MLSNEKVLIVGDIKHIEAKQIAAAVDALQPVCSVIYRSDPARMIQTLVDQLQTRPNGEDLYIIATDPKEVITGIKNSFCPQKTALTSATLLVVSSSGHPFGYSDRDTGMRVVSFPDTPCRFPIHPTPDF